MFIRIKKSKNSPKCSVQIVESKRVDGKVKQKIVKHMGTAMEGIMLPFFKTSKTTFLIPSSYDTDCNSFPPLKSKLLI